MKKIILLLFVVSFSQAQNYALDTSFGTLGTGYVLSNNSAGLTKDAIFMNNNYYVLTSHGVLIKYNSQGVMDTSFGTNGYVHLLTLITGYYSLNINGFKFENGNFFIYGGAYNGQHDIFVAKVSVSGIMDSAFGTNGIDMINFGQYEVATDIAFTSNGQILLAADRKMTGLDDAFIYCKLNANGSLDSAFDPSGFKTITATGRMYSYFIKSVGNDFLLIGINVSDKLFTTKIDASGNVDTSYGQNGSVRLDLQVGGYLTLTDCDIKNDYLYIAYNSMFTNTSRGYLTKINLTNWSVASSQISEYDSKFKIKNDKIYITGTTYCGFSNCGSVFKLRRWNMDLSNDTSFQETGYFSYNIPPQLFDRDISRVFWLHDDGRITIIGHTIPVSSSTESTSMLRIEETTVPLGSGESEKLSAKCYPNPFTDEIRLDAVTGVISNIRILDNLGRTIYQPDFIQNDKTAIINTSVLSQSGMYFLNLQFEDRTENIRIVRK